MRLGRLLVLFLLLLSGGAVAAAPTKALQAQVDRGTAALEQGRFDEAIELLEDAFAKLKEPDPLLLLNIGQAHRKAGHTQPAISAFERFLQAQPDSPYRPKVEKYLTDLRALQNPPPPALLPPPPPIVVAQPPPQLTVSASPAAPPSRPIYKRAWFWGVIGGVVGAAAVAGTVGGILASRSSSISGVNTLPTPWMPIQ